MLRIREPPSGLLLVRSPPMVFSTSFWMQNRNDGHVFRLDVTSRMYLSRRQMTCRLAESAHRAAECVTISSTANCQPLLLAAGAELNLHICPFSSINDWAISSFIIWLSTFCSSVWSSISGSLAQSSSSSFAYSRMRDPRFNHIRKQSPKLILVFIGFDRSVKCFNETSGKRPLTVKARWNVMLWCKIGKLELLLNQAQVSYLHFFDREKDGSVHWTHHHGLRIY